MVANACAFTTGQLRSRSAEVQPIVIHRLWPQMHPDGELCANGRSTCILKRTFPNSQASSSPNREEKERAAREETCCPCTMAWKLDRHNAIMGILVVNQKPEP